LRRQEAIRKKERQDKGDEEREQKLIRDQIERAEMTARQDDDDDARELKREEGGTIKLSFGAKLKESEDPPPPAVVRDEKLEGLETEQKESISPPTGVPTPPPEKVSLKMGTSNKPKNVFAGLSKKIALSSKGSVKETPKKPMSEAERIMKEEIERKRMRGGNGAPGLSAKRPRLG